MISGGNATVYVSDMDAAVRFYSDTLGMKLTNRFGDHWATVEAGKSLTIGLHPASPDYPAPGTKGSVMLGLEIDEPIETVVARLKEKGEEAAFVEQQRLRAARDEADRQLATLIEGDAG